MKQIVFVYISQKFKANLIGNIDNVHHIGKMATIVRPTDTSACFVFISFVAVAIVLFLYGTFRQR